MHIPRRQTGKPHRRHGATIVETALILMIAMMVIFGIFEYARLMYLRQVMENAVRDGARLAAVTTDVRGTSTATLVTAVQQRVLDRLGNQQKQLNNHTTTTAVFTTSQTATSDIRVYRSDNTGLVPTKMQRDVTTGIPTRVSGVIQVTTYTLDNWFNSPYTEAWYGDQISVQIACTYRPIIRFVKLNTTVAVQITSTVNSEGN